MGLGLRSSFGQLRMAFRTGTLRGVSCSHCVGSPRRISRLFACGAAVMMSAAMAAAVTAAPLSLAWMMFGSHVARAVIHSDDPANRKVFVDLKPQIRLAERTEFSVVWRRGSVADLGDPHDEVIPQPVVLTAGIVSLPPSRESIAVELLSLPPINPVLLSQVEPKDMVVTPSAPPSVARLASVPQSDGSRKGDVAGKVPSSRPALPLLDDGRTAVYDIAARIVHMPNGEKLEAHSGLGIHFDDPRSSRVKNRGVTPPNVYNLKLRESLFHGVAAVRLNPVDAGKMYGRDGFLAHSYLLGPRGESNGCVSFRDYGRFLQAFRRGEVSRMVVVARLAGPPSSVLGRAGSDVRYASNKEAEQ